VESVHAALHCRKTVAARGEAGRIGMLRMESGAEEM